MPGRRRTVGLVVALAVGMAVPPPAIAAPVVANWQMNEDADASMMTDSSGNGVQGQIGSAVQTGVTVQGATLYRWSNTSPNEWPPKPERVIQIDDDRLNPGTGDFAVEARFRTTRPFGNILQKGQATTPGGYFKWQMPNGRLECLFRGYDAQGNTQDLLVNSLPRPPLDDGAWHTVRCERRGNRQIMTVDGVQTGNRQITFRGPIANDVPMTIGGKINCDQIRTTCDYFVGDIDWVRVEGEGVSGPPPPDTTPPITTITSGPSGTIATDGATFAFDANEGSTFECRLDAGAWQGCSSPHEYDGLADRPHTFEVRATDTSGNTDESPDSRSFTVDTTAPDTTITAGPSGIVVTGGASFEFSADEPGSSFECRLDAGGWQTCTSPQVYDGLADGDHTFAVRATDPVGNQGTAADRSFAVDTTAPDTTITAGPSGIVVTGGASFEFSADEPGSSFECRLDAGGWQTCTSPQVYDGLADGDHTFAVRATDPGGHADPLPATRTWTVETTPSAPPVPGGSGGEPDEGDGDGSEEPTGVLDGDTERTKRLAGPTRYATAVAIALHEFPDGADTVFLARADDVVDAVAGGVLTGGPVVLVDSCRPLPRVVAEALVTLAPDRVVALGGTAAICDDVLDAAGAAAGVSTSRLAGPTRYATAVAIALHEFPDGADTVFLARADDVVDAVAGGVLTGGPVVLVDSCGPLPRVVAEALVTLAPDRVVALGGTAAICDDVLDAAGAAAGVSTLRLAGPTRYATAVAIALHEFPDGADTVFLARADDVVDAVAGGVLTGGPVVLVDSCGPLPRVVAEALVTLAPDRVVALGGTAAICDDVLDGANA